MLPYYLGSLTLGGVFILTSIFFGDADTDVDAGMDIDMDLDLDADEAALAVFQDPSDAISDTGTWIPFFSLRFWTFALASFGLAGTLLELLGVASLIGAAVSVVLGIGIGTGASWTFRALQTSQVSGNIGMRDVRGKEATVLIPVGPDKVGKIRLLIDGQYVDLPARTQGDRLLEVQDKALVVDVAEGMADITSVPAGYQSMKTEH